MSAHVNSVCPAAKSNTHAACYGVVSEVHVHLDAFGSRSKPSPGTNESQWRDVARAEQHYGSPCLTKRSMSVWLAGERERGRERGEGGWITYWDAGKIHKSGSGPTASFMTQSYACMHVDTRASFFTNYIFIYNDKQKTKKTKTPWNQTSTETPTQLWPC